MEIESTGLEETAAKYFSSISYLASKMMQYNESVKELYQDTWDSLSFEKQEQLLDKHIIDPEVVEKYASWKRPQEPPSCFPVLKVSSGEKVIVDFEHDDGWTWVDEHSAPFSWKTKSQQDLTLADLYDAGNSKEENGKKSRVGKKTRSPDRSMFDSNMASGERNKNEVEKMFEKFGIKVAGGSDEDGDEKLQDPAHEVKDPENTMSPSHLYNEHSKLLGHLGDTDDSLDLLCGSSGEFLSGKETGGIRKSKSKQNASAAKTKESKGKGVAKKEKGKGTKTTKKKKPSTESVDVQNQSAVAVTMSFANCAAVSAEIYEAESDSKSGQRQPVKQIQSNSAEAFTPIRFTEIGESSTDDLDEKFEMNGVTPAFETSLQPQGASMVAGDDDVFSFSVFSDKSSVITSQPKKVDLNLDEMLAVSHEQAEVRTESVTKSGFDFLDNW